MPETLFAAGMRRINVSLDSRDPDRFRHITRTAMSKVLGRDRRGQGGRAAIKINMVALKG
jgi:cyclic pyranopterin phosphate synthase